MSISFGATVPVEVVASTLARGVEHLRQQASRAAAGGADWLELRLDRWPDGEDLALGDLGLPVLATCRMPRDGGVFAGSVEQRRVLLERALVAGARGIDLEHWETWSPDHRPQRVVRSFHATDGVPADLSAIREQLLAAGGDLTKIVVAPRELADIAPAMALLAAIDQRETPTVVFGLGAACHATRVLACLLGAPCIYGCVDDDEQVAPGQRPVSELVDLYRVHALSERTSLFGLLGDPALHSLGPCLHNRAFARLGIDAVYLALETARPEQVVDLLALARLRGLSVTSPHKQRAAAICHALHPPADACGAVNTLLFDDAGAVHGHNTDVEGVRAALRGAGLTDDGASHPAAVLGAGGASRAAALALEGMGFEVTVVGRDGLTAAALGDLEPRVVVHATPVGGAGRPDASATPVPGWTPVPGATVLDMVYRPEVTPLLRTAAAAGAIAVSGVEMFLAQAAAQLELFVGRRLAADELRELLPT